MDKDISIYVPVYNGEKTIKACLDSILNQSLKPKKILVINDNSDDKTLDILNEYKNKIEIIITEIKNIMSLFLLLIKKFFILSLRVFVLIIVISSSIPKSYYEEHTVISLHFYNTLVHF